MKSGDGDVDPGHLDPVSTHPVDQMLADLLGDLADRRRIGHGDRKVDRGGPARQLDVDLGAGRKVGVRADAEKPAAAATGGSDLAGGLAGNLLDHLVVHYQPSPAGRRCSAGQDNSGCHGVSAVRWTGRPAPEVELALKHPTDHQPGRRKQQNDHERDKPSEDGHDAERDPNDHGELGCGHNSRCSFG